MDELNVPVPPGHRALVFVTGKVVGLGVNVDVALFHVLLGTDTFAASIVQTGAPKTLITIRALPLVTSTDVVLVAVRVHALEEVTATVLPATLELQLEKVGPAGVVPPISVVKASAPPADRTPALKVHDTNAEPSSSRNVPSALSVVFAGSQFAAEAEPAPNSAIIIEAATAAVPSFFMLRMLLSFCRPVRPTVVMDELRPATGHVDVITVKRRSRATDRRAARKSEHPRPAVVEPQVAI